MRKFLLSTIALLMTISVMAVGSGDGSNKANAIDFDWTNGHVLESSTGSWYRVDLSPLKAEANDPTLALYLTNLTDEVASVSLKLEATLLGQSMNQTSNYNIAAKDYQLWSKQSFDYNGRKMSLKQLISAGLSEVYLQLTSSKKIVLSAKVYETEDIVDDACSKAKDFDWTGVSVPAGEQWYRLNLSEVKTNGNKLKFVVKNNGGSEANVAFDMSLDCPASAVIEKDWTIVAGAEKEDEFGRIFLDVLNEDYVFVKLTTNQPLMLSVEEETVVVDPNEFADFNCASATELVFNKEMNLTAGKHVYKVKRAELIAERDFDTEFNVTNLTSETANLAVEVAFACPVKSVVTQKLVLNANESIMKLVKGDMLKAVNSEWVYIRFITDQDLTAMVGMRNVSPCVNAVDFDWNTGAKLSAGESQWYEMDITSLIQNKKHLGLSFTNHADAIALVNVEVALDCDGTILPITLPVPNGVSLSQVIDYQILKRSPLNRIYVSVSTDSDIELVAWTKDAIAADKTPCLNALNPEHGVEYVHEANTTKWYKISLDLLESTSSYSSIYLANKGNKRANVTIGMVTDCQYTTSTTITLPLPTGFDFGALAPNVLGRLLKQVARFEGAYNKVDAKDVYLEIHSDEPVAFGLDVTNASTNPCLRDDLIAFDWNKGATVDASAAKWFDMNLDDVKAAGKHVKLTFTNKTDSLVWAATVVSVECPAKLTMPLIVPVPAGMSVDHVINYQLFAVVDLHNIYVGVLTDGALELKAEGLDAEVIPSANCLTAKTIVSGEEYVQNPGSQWYKFPMSLIDEMGSAAKLSFENKGSNHATISAGVSVGCEYAPITCAKAKVLRNFGMSLNMPRQIISKLRGLIDPAIAEFYLQLTTDQTIAFSFKNQNTGANACASAMVFDWNTWEQNGLLLEANKENWYKVNIATPLKKLMDGEDITVIVSNSNSMDVEVDLAVSPTCPVLLSLDKSVTIPAGLSVGVTVSLADIINFIEQYDQHNLLGRDYKELLKQVNAYTLYNKLNQMLIERGYYDNVSAYVPVDRIESLINKYGEEVSLVNLKKLLEDPKKYISVAEIKAQLVSVKDKVQNKAEEKLTFDNMIAALEKYGDKIPYVDAQTIINNADLILPYVGSAKIVLDKCKQYITIPDLDKIVVRCKELVPFDALKELKVRLEDYIKQHLPEPNVMYIYAKSTGDLMITSEVETPEGCEDAVLLDWTKTINLSDLTKGWYRLDISDLHVSKADFTLSLNNNTGDVKKLGFSFYKGCSPDGSAMSDMYLTKLTITAPKGLTTETVPYAALDYLLGDDVMELYVYLDMESGELNEACMNAMLLDDPNVPHNIKLIAGEEQWFKVATNALEKLQYNLKITVDAEVADVNVAVSSSCLVEPVIDTTVVLDKAYNENLELSKNNILDKWSKYSNKVSGIDTAYVRVVSTGNITLSTDTVTPTAPAEPDSCLNGTLLDWTQTVNLSTLTTGWYKFDISSLHASQSDFTLSLNNDMGETKAVDMTLYLSCDKPYEAKTTQVFPVGITKRDVAYSLLKQVVGLADMLYVYIKTDVELPIIPDADACLKAIELTWNDTLTINAGDTTWYMLPLAEAKALGKDLELTVSNISNVDANVYVAVAETCPVLAYLTERTGTVPANMTLSRTLFNNELKSLADTVYFRLYSSTDLVISANVAVEEPEKPQGCEDAILLDWTKTIKLSDLKTGWYKFDISSIHGSNKDFTLSLNNDLGEAKNLGFKLYRDCNSSMLASTVLKFKVGLTSYTIPASLISLAEGIDMLYVHLTLDAPFPCEDAILFDWNEGAYQEANKTQWYEFDITPVLEQEKQVKLTFTNHSNENAWVVAELAMNCPYTKSIPIIVPVPANMSVDKWIDYSLFEASRVKHFYLGVTTREAAIELDATWEDARIAPSDGCLNATKVENEVLYEHAAGTHWYKFTRDLFDKEGYFSRVHVINRSAKTVNITAGGTVGCEYNIATRTNFKLPMRFDLAFAIPVWVIEQIDRFVDNDVTEFYMELTTDQPIAFSFGMDACQEAIPFDWATGHTQEALTTQWYEVDITSVKANKQQVKLTFTNHSNTTAWVASLVSLDCPFKVALPAVLPIPAGASVDHVLDYSYFAATRLQHLYVGVTTEEKISVKAEAQDATANPTDKAACEKAIEVKSGEVYNNKGTQWYKFSGKFFEDATRLPQFIFAAPEGKANVTLGATVGCEYNIANRGTLSVPNTGDLSLAFRFPSFIFDVIKKFVNPEVTEFYLEMTSDKQVNWGLNMDYVGTCSGAEELDLLADLDLNLKANEDVWYIIDLNKVKAMGNEMISLNLTNSSSQSVEVEFEVSPTCPLAISALKSVSVPANTNLPAAFPASAIIKLYDEVISRVNVPEEIANNLPSRLEDDMVYFVRVRANGDLHIDNKKDSVPEVVVPGCEDAKLLDFTKTIYVDSLQTGWYRVDLTAITTDFTVVLENNTGINKTLKFQFYQGCDADEAKMKDMFLRSYSLVAPHGRIEQYVPYSSISSFITMDELYIYLEMEDGGEVDMACAEALLINPAEPFTIVLEEGKEQWFKVATNAFDNFKNNLVVSFENPNAKDVTVDFSLATACPALVTVDSTITVDANYNRVDSITAGMIEVAVDKYADRFTGVDTAYIRVLATGRLTLNVDTFAVEEAPDGCENAILLDWTKTINLSELRTGWYKFDISSIHGSNKDFTLSLNNDLGEAKNLGFKLYRDCNSSMLAERVVTFKVGLTTYTIPASLISMVDGIDMLYVYLTLDAPFPCEDAILFDWNEGAYQEANKTQWYEFDIAPVLEQEKQVKLTFTNHSNENAWVVAELAMNCPYTKSIPIIVPVPANMSVDKWIDYSLFEASRVKHFYLGVTTREAAIELDATWEDARIAPSDGCLNATKVENEVLYEHAAGTHWYKFTRDLFDKEGYFSRVHVINRSAKTVNITAGGTVGCEYNIATRTNFKLPMRFDLAFAIPVWVIEQIDRFVDNDVTEFYMELTTDQPIAFSFGMDACQEAIPFDWTTGHTQEALTTQWYEVDIAPVLANEQQIKLTMTNHSNQTAWVATLVSLDCPFKVAMPLAFPIPAGMSVDKVIDYSYFAATRFDHIYVGVTTDSKISIIAEAQSAEASAADKQGCANATLLENGKNYTHPAGTAWYKVDGSFFANMSTLPTFRFATISGETTKVTMGATVGCEYNIATRGTVSVPGGIDLSLRMPRFIFKAMKLLVRDDVNEIYVQMITDKPVEFAIDTTTTEDLDACLDAIDLIVTDSMTFNLVGNTEQWYKVDVSALKGTNKDLAIKAINPSAEPVDVEVEISATCPVVASVTKTETVPASLNVTKVVTAEQIAKAFEKYPDIIYYVRVRTNGDLQVEISEYIPPVDGCAEAIEYVWGTDVVVNKEAWYKLAIADLRDQACNIKLTVTNTTNDSVSADLALFDSCPIDLPIVEMEDLAIAANTVRTEEVSSEYLPDDADTLFLHIQPTGELTVNLSSNCIPELKEVYAYDTISSYDCVDARQMWNDTVRVNVSAILDSVYVHTYVVDPFEAPVAMTDSILATIVGAKPELKQGVEPDMTASADAIKAYYQTQDTETIADVVDVTWNTVKVDCDATSYTIKLVVEDNCGRKQETTHTFNDIVVRPAGVEEFATICYGEKYVWQSRDYTATGVYNDTLKDVNGCDSVNVLHLTVLPAVVDEVDTVIICNGESYSWSVNNGKIYNQTGRDTVVISNSLGCDSIYQILDLTVMPAAVYAQVEKRTICFGQSVEWRGTYYGRTGVYKVAEQNVNGCDSIIYTLDLTVAPDVVYMPEEHAVICQGSTFTWNKNGGTYDADGVYTYIEKGKSGCDSVAYYLNLDVVSDGTTLAKTICHGKSHTIQTNGKEYTYSQSGIYKISLPSGCEFTFVLDVLPAVPMTYVDTVVCGTSFEWNHEVFTASGSYERILKTAVYGCDSVVTLKLTLKQPAVSEQTIAACDSYEWNGNTYTVSGDYTFITTAANGCDSTATLHLTINSSEAETYTVSACDPYTWNGQTYTQSGTYTYNTTTATGCGRVETLVLTINESVTASETVTACGSYAWNGQTYTQSGDYEQTLTAANGCDSVVTLHLTVNQPVTAEFSATACVSYTWTNGQTYTQSGDYEQTLTAANGCDSVVTLHLTINQPVAVELNETACGSYTWNGQTYTHSGNYQQTFVAANGCDSVVILHLTINEIVYKEFTELSCDSYTWNGQVYSATGDYTQTFKAANGCDSIVTLHLHIVQAGTNTDTTVTICENELPYIWNGQQLTNGGTYTDTLSECNATVTLHLIVNQSVTTEFSATTCGSYTWNSFTYATSGDYIQTFQAANGCDSTVTLHLTINQPVVAEFSATACASYTWNSATYITSGDYVQKFTAANGCDSTVTLHLTINQPVTAEFSATACGSYTWNSATYITSGNYVQTLQTANGCDSTVTLHLTINQPVAVELNETACVSYTWTNGQTYTASGDYEQTLTAANGCDSTVTLHLTILPPVKDSVEFMTICYGEVYDWNGMKCSAPTDYVYTIENSLHCDSIRITLHLSVRNEVPVVTETEAICSGDSYEWGRVIYSSDTVVTKTLDNIYGCDSTVTFKLIVHDEILPTFKNVDIYEGESYVWVDTTLTTAGTYTKTFPSELTGCDSVVNLKLNVLPKSTVKVPVTGLVCDGTEYVDPITKEAHIISSLIPSTWTWTTTVAGVAADTIYQFEITPIVAPELLDSATLVTIPSAAPILVQGEKPQVDIDAISDYYKAVDTDAISDVDSIMWSNVDTILACDALTHEMTLTVVDMCDNILTMPFIFAVQPRNVEEQLTDTTICYGEIYSWYDNNGNFIKDCSEGGEYRDTIRTSFGCDSIIRVLDLTIRPAIDTTFEYKTICFGDIYYWPTDGNLYNKDTVVSVSKVSVHGCDSIIELRLNVLPAAKVVTTDTVICAGETITWIDGVVYNATTQGKVYTAPYAGTTCDSIIATLNLTVKPAAKVVTTDTVICAGETITWIDGVVYDATTIGKAYTAKYAGTICDSIIATLNLTVKPAAKVVTTDTVICAGETITWIDGVVYNATTIGKAYTAKYAGTTCDSVIGTLNLRVLPAATIVTTDTVICAGETITWIDGVVYNATTIGKAYTAKYAGTTCDSIIATLNLTVKPAATVVTTDTVICAGETITWIDGVVYDVTTQGKVYTAPYAGTICDSIIGTLNLTVLPAATVVTTDTVICAGETITWIDGVVYDATTQGKVYTAPYAGTTCDSIIATLNLTVLPETVTENEKLIICESEFPYTWHDTTLTTIGTYTIVDKFVGHDCDSVIHVLELQTYVMTLPDNVTMPIAVCGNPVDVVAATADIEAHIAATDLYAPNAVVTWFVDNNGNWTELNNDPIKGGVNDVTVKYVITSDCGTIESNPFTVTVEAPTPENDVDMDNILIVSKYENRIFLLHLNDFETRFGWTPAPEEVTWYKVVDEIDIVGVDGPTGDDLFVGTGHAYNETDGSTIEPGDYYAVIVRTTVEHPDDCHTTMKSVVLSSGVVTMIPELVSNVVAPNENLRLINLSSEEITEVYVYNMTGELIETYVVEKDSEFIFNAAHVSGYYLIDVKTANAKTTLRYIVK